MTDKHVIPFIEDPKMEAKYQRLEKLGTELKIPTFRSFLTLEVLGKDGNSIYAHKQRSHSWNRNAYNFLFSQMSAVGLFPTNATFEAGVVSLKAYSGTTWPNVSGWGLNYAAGYDEETNLNAVSSSASAGLMASAAVTEKGIMVGTGVGAEDFEGYVLDNPIVNGSGAGQMDIAQSNLHALTYDVPSKTLTNTLVRYFNNNSSGEIVIGETGLYHRLKFKSAGVQTIMTCRDLLTPAVAVPNTGQLKVTYTIELIYPA